MSSNENLLNTSATPAPSATSTTSIYSHYINALFSQLDARHVDSFYRHYRHWKLEQQQLVLQKQLATLEEQIVNNTTMMDQTQPSSFALDTVTHLQSYGVTDIELLDAMVERGDAWLNNIMRLLDRCEQLDAIHGGYTEWCRYALEGAYDWLNSIDANDFMPVQHTQHTQDTRDASEQVEPTTTKDTLKDALTEELFLQKLSSEDESPSFGEKLTETQRDRQSLPNTSQTQHVGETLAVSQLSSYPQKIETQGDREGLPNTSQTQLSSYPLPSLLSYTTSHTPQSQEIVVPLLPQASTIAQSLVERPRENLQKKSPGYGVVSRILAKVWRA